MTSFSGLIKNICAVATKYAIVLCSDLKQQQSSRVFSPAVCFFCVHMHRVQSRTYAHQQAKFTDPKTRKYAKNFAPGLRVGIC